MRLKFANKEYELKSLTLNDWIDAEENGLNLKRLQDPNNLNFKDIRLLVFIIVKKVDPETTLEYIGEHLNLDNMGSILEQVSNFIKPKGA